MYKATFGDTFKIWGQSEVCWSKFVSPTICVFLKAIFGQNPAHVIHRRKAMNQTYLLEKSVEQNPDDMDSVSCELQKWRRTKISYRKLWWQKMILLTNKEKVSLSFSTMALIPLVVGVDVELVDGLWLLVDGLWLVVDVELVVGWCAPKVSTWCEAGQERTGWLIAGNQMNLANTIPLLGYWNWTTQWQSYWIFVDA